jgi:3',5'-cyclic AMP phosphodiesterase CpdA
MFKKIFYAILALGAVAAVSNTHINTPATTKTTRNFMLISDMHVMSPENIQHDTGDAPMALFEQFISKTDSVLNHTAAMDFIIYTGDLPAHTGLGPIDPASIAAHDSDLVTALRGLQKLAKNHPGIPLFYLPGNNDAETGDYRPFSNAGSSAFQLAKDATNPFPALNINRASNQPPCLADKGDTVLCYYSAYLVKGLRLIALNTVVYTNNFFRNVAGATAMADKEMNWLAGQLADAKTNNEKVYIAMHVPPVYIDHASYKPDQHGWTRMPPGNKNMKTYESWFYSLLDKYGKGCVEAVFYGHTHMDELYLLKQNNKKMGVAISCPGICFAHGNNSGFKTVLYDSAAKSVLDFTTYFTNRKQNWGTDSYSFSSIFSSNPLQQTVFERLSAMTDADITAGVRKIYKVNPK